jgi:glycosyltransferase involved in cell wall biosynthesis
MKKVFYIITKSNWGGAQKYVFDLATSLPKETYEATVILGGKGLLVDRLAEANIRTISLSSLQRDISIWSDIQSLVKLFLILKKERPDIVHVNSSKVGGLGAFAARILCIPRVIFTCHGWPFNEDRDQISLWIIKLFSWLTVMIVHITIAVSSRDEIDGKNLLWAKNKICLVHNGIRQSPFKTHTEAFSTIKDMAQNKGVNIDKTDFIVGAIGELHKNKGYEYLIEAFSAMPTGKLVIIGEGEERIKLEAQIKKLNLEKRVVLLGFIKEAYTYLKAFGAYTLTSIKEGLPYVVIEAGFAALPVVVTNVGGVKDIVEDMKSGILIQTRKPTDVAKGLMLIQEDTVRAKIFSENLHQKTTNEFSLSKMIEKTVDVYEGRE